MTHSATGTTHVTGHDWSLTSKMTSWGAFWTCHDQSHTSKMTGWGQFVIGQGVVCHQSHTIKMAGQGVVCTATDQVCDRSGGGL